MIQVMRTACNVCGVEAKDETQKRHENWITLEGEIRVGLEKPRTKNGGFVHSIGFGNHRADFCSIECFNTALLANKSLE